MILSNSIKPIQTVDKEQLSFASYGNSNGYTFIHFSAVRGFSSCKQFTTNKQGSDTLSISGWHDWLDTGPEKIVSTIFLGIYHLNLLRIRSISLGRVLLRIIPHEANMLGLRNEADCHLKTNPYLI